MTRFERLSACAAFALAVTAAPGQAQEPSPSPTAPPATTPPGYPAPAPVAPADNRPVLNLSLQDTVARALENNTDIAVARVDPEIDAALLRQAKGVFEPLLFSTVTANSVTSQPRSVFAGGTTVVDTNTTVFNLGAAQLLPTGGNWRVDFNNFKQSTDAAGTNFNPSFSSELVLQFQQPLLLRNWGIDANRYQIHVAQRNRDISEVQYKQTVLNTVASVKQLYYDLIYANDNLAAQRQSLALATKLVEENRIKVRVGTMAPLDVVAAEAEQASREELVIVAENALAEAEDTLKSVIFPRSEPETWNLRIVPTERPTAEPVPVDIDAAIRNALERRTDLQAARLSLDNADYAVKFTKNQTLPQLDLVASYGSSGVGGTQIVRDDPLGPPTGTVPGGFSDALSSVFGRDFPTWSLGVNVSYPILNRQNQAANARARLTRDQALASLRRTELQVAVEVRSAGRAVETNYKRVESTRAARVLAERRLDAEEKKFAAGLSTNFLVTQAQRDLSVAQVSELQAIADFRKSVVNFDRVQESGGGGVTFTLVNTAFGTSTNRLTASPGQQ